MATVCVIHGTAGFRDDLVACFESDLKTGKVSPVIFVFILLPRGADLTRGAGPLLRERRPFR